MKKAENQHLTLKSIVLLLLSIVALVLGSTVCNAQDREQKFAFYTYSDPMATYNDGFNIGVGIEYQMNVLYFKAQTFTFPDLRGKTYTDLVGVPLGFNQHIGFWDNFRAYEGLMLGLIFRDGVTFPTVGGEIGIDWNLADNVFVGIGGNYMLRQDGKVWEANAKDYWRANGVLKLGIKW